MKTKSTKNKSKQKLEYDYVMCLRWNDYCENFFGVKDLDALMPLVIQYATDKTFQKEILDWTVITRKQAKQYGYDKQVYQVCLGPVREKKSKKRGKK